MARSPHSSRLLSALELLQTRGRLTGAELARRLRVERRTVRRYISALDEMGIPVTTERGRAGGYELVAGYRLPPLLFTDDEVVAISLGLAAVRGLGLPAETHAVTSAQAKLERVMPKRLRGRMRGLDEASSFGPAPSVAARSASVLSVIAEAIHEEHTVRLTYRAPSGTTVRGVDPYGLAFIRGHGYLTGFCHLRRDIRSFRLDRIAAAEGLDWRFERPATFDALEHLRASISRLPRTFSIEVLLKTDLHSATQRLMPELGVLEAEGAHVRMRSQADDLDWFARELAALPWRVVVRQPRELSRALARQGRELLKSAAESDASGPQSRLRASKRSTRAVRALAT